MSHYEVIGHHVPDSLIGGVEAPLMVTKVTLLAGQGVLPRGSVIGIVTIGGKGKLVDKASNDGSQIARLILCDETDTTHGDVDAVCYKTGVFNRNRLFFGGASTAADHEAELHDVGIYLKEEF